MNAYSLLPFEFRRHADGSVLLVNECGDFLSVSAADFQCLCEKRFGDLTEGARHSLVSRHLICESARLDSTLELCANKYRSRREYLNSSTALHMMVVTLRCNHKCEYCQVSSAEDDAYKYDMPPSVAERVVDLVFQSPGNDLKIEFQGGDALLNWPTVMAAVRRAEQLNESNGKNLEFVICTNLYALTKEHLKDIKAHRIMISTSLDGPRCLHDMHRLLRHGGSSYDTFVEKLSLARSYLGNDSVHALMTASADSIERIEEIIDTYLELGFGGVFFRALNPYGDAYKNKLYYSPESFFTMYRNGLEHILELNQKGTPFVEYYTALLLRRILTPYATGFVDLQSPSGAGISGVIYDYTGDVYPADEARMLARMGNTTFRMGNVFKDSYQEIFLSDVLRSVVKASCVETIPGCSTCAYRTYCGVDVFRNYLETGDVANVRSDSFFCQKQSMIFDYLFNRIEDPEFLRIVAPWVRC